MLRLSSNTLIIIGYNKIKIFALNIKVFYSTFFSSIKNKSFLLIYTEDEFLKTCDRTVIENRFEIVK